MAGNATEVCEFFTHIWSASFTTLLTFTGSVCPTRWRMFLHLRLPGWVIIIPGLGWAPKGVDSGFEYLRTMTTTGGCVYLGNTSFLNNLVLWCGQQNWLNNWLFIHVTTNQEKCHTVSIWGVTVSLLRVRHSPATAWPAASRIAFETPVGEKDKNK